MLSASKRDDENVREFKDQFMHEPNMLNCKLVQPPLGLHVGFKIGMQLNSFLFSRKIL